MRLLSLFGIALTFLAGCETAVSPPGNSGPAPDAIPARASATNLSPEQVNLTTGDEKTLATLLEAHQGEVVFVDYWATWCHPCVEYFPHTVEMHGRFKDQGLAVIAVSFDEVDDEPKVREYLAQQGADFEHVLSKYGIGTEANEAFDLDQVPHFRLYDRSGKLVRKWDDKPTDADEKIEELLKAGSGKNE